MENDSATDNPLPQGKAKPKRPWRDNLEAIGIAILIAVLLKPLVIEAYQIPTPSMQPTMMGSKAAGVHDRLLVDKMRYAFTEPKRFDIAVFRYPVRRNQNYVKRI
ncbi:MAG: signal peptidase I, partial [Planctomycetota bacterium]|nr:signal peptidase I [Planctomycetota bacterium]